MCLLLQAVEVPARLLKRGLRIFHARFDLGHSCLRLFDTRFALLNQNRKLLDLALAFEQAMSGGVGRKQRDALPADNIATGRHITRAR